MKQKPIVFPLFNTDTLAKKMQKECGFALGSLTLHSFPDEETVVVFNKDVQDKQLIFTAQLDRPNAKILPLLFAAETARSLGASMVYLIAPYLAYMRQDTVFAAGQGITSSYFAQLIAQYFDGLITVDPHLHRWPELSAVYHIPNTTLHARDAIARWINTHVKKPVFVGPDAESRQWVKDIALAVHAPYVVLDKIRAGDSQVFVSAPNLAPYKDYTPVLVDDIISTGRTMIEAVQRIRACNMPAPVCIGVHAIFAGDAYQDLLASGAGAVITSNTIAHPSNRIDIHDVIIQHVKTSPEFSLAVKKFFKG